MKKIALAIALLALIALSAPAIADICTIENTPAATLLLPYFEVDLDNPAGVTTLFSVNNASAAPTLVHVVVWSDLSVPVLDFNIYLTGYDVQSINIRDIIAGSLPQTASVGQDPADTISPQGNFSGDINYPSCSGQLPPPPLPADFIAHLENSLTGQPSALLSGRCAGRDLGDNVARGYITMDVVNNCTLRFPGDAGYFTGDIEFDNILWGDYFYVDPANAFAQGETLVHIEADQQAFAAGDYTFYGRYNTWTAIDGREPLATNFATRFLNGGAFTGGTDLIVWRDSQEATNAFTCPVAAGARPPWYRLGQEAIVIFDEEEQPDVPTTIPVSPQPPGQSLTPFPAESQRVAVGGPNFPVPFDFGWLYLNLNHSYNPASLPGNLLDVAQAWVVTRMDADGLYSVGFDAIQLDSACAPLIFDRPGGIN